MGKVWLRPVVPRFTEFDAEEQLKAMSKEEWSAVRVALGFPAVTGSGENAHCLTDDEGRSIAASSDISDSRSAQDAEADSNVSRCETQGVMDDAASRPTAAAGANATLRSSLAYDSTEKYNFEDEYTYNNFTRSMKMRYKEVVAHDRAEGEKGEKTSRIAGL